MPLSEPAAAIGPALEGAPSLLSVAFDLASVGYSVHEHLASGTASSFRSDGPRPADGRWSVAPAGNAPFTTRIVVHRPTDAAGGNGTVVVEWLNVTGGLDVPALWMATHRHLVRAGFTWVGVSAQEVGIVGGGMLPGLGLLQAAPDRYASLAHPGDAYAFDLFTQVGRAVRAWLPELYGIEVERVVATGASQSAFHLTTYVNAVDPLAEAFDGYLLQGRAGAGVPIEGWRPGTIGPNVAAEARRARLVGNDRIRDDARVPVVVVQSETDVFGALAYLPARQADTDRFRLWEVAGAAHCDTYFLCASPQDSGSLPVEQLASLVGRAEDSGMPTPLPINSGPQMHYVLQRAFDALDRWTRTGSAPPTAQRLGVDEDGGLAVDALGVARGGVRTPWVDVPTGVLSGLGQPGDMTDLFGTTRRFDGRALRARYPGGRDDYVREFVEATRSAVTAGFLLAVDAPEIDALGACSWRGA
jgi:hypothetical protein